MKMSSKRQDLVEERPLPKGVRTLSVTDIELGVVLGSGGFSNVFSCSLSPKEAPPIKSQEDHGCRKENARQLSALDQNKVPPALVQTWSSGSGSSSSHSSLTRPTSPLHTSSTDPENNTTQDNNTSTLPNKNQSTARQKPVSSTNTQNEHAQKPSQQSSTSTSSSSPSTTSQLFAFKTVHSKVLEKNPKGRKHAVEGLMMEVSILTSRRFAQHPHIINLHGISEDFWTAGEVLKQASSSSQNNTDLGASVFIVLERLPRTLDQVLHSWKQHSKKQQNQSPAWMFWNNNNNNNNRSGVSSCEERIRQVLPSLCEALVCLHQNGIVHRDVKPSNIGFDHHGTLKLFDFGSARMLQTATNKRSTKKTHLTSRAGTLRYVSAITKTRTVNVTLHDSDLLFVSLFFSTDGT